MRTIDLDGSRWKTALDVYRGLAVALERPEYTGGSPDAMLELLVWDGDRNPIRPPYIVRIAGAAGAPEEVRSEIALLTVMVEDACAEYSKYQWNEGRVIQVKLESDVPVGDLARARQLVPRPPADWDPNGALEQIVLRLNQAIGRKPRPDG